MWCIMVMRLTVCVVYYGYEADCMCGVFSHSMIKFQC